MFAYRFSLCFIVGIRPFFVNGPSVCAGHLDPLLSLTNRRCVAIIEPYKKTGVLLPSQKDAAENRKSGANPERCRHCMCGGRTRGESRSLEPWFREGGVRAGETQSQETCSPRPLSVPAITGRDGILCAKTAAAVRRTAAFFIPLFAPKFERNGLFKSRIFHQERDQA